MYIILFLVWAGIKFIYSFIYLFIYLFIHLSIFLFIYLLDYLIPAHSGNKICTCDITPFHKCQLSTDLQGFIY